MANPIHEAAMRAILLGIIDATAGDLPGIPWGEVPTKTLARLAELFGGGLVFASMWKDYRDGQGLGDTPGE